MMRLLAQGKHLVSSDGRAVPAEPCPIEQALEASWRIPLGTDHHLDQLLQAIAQPLQERLR